MINIDELRAELNELKKELHRYEKGASKIGNITKKVPVGVLFEAQYPDAEGWFFEETTKKNGKRMELCYGGYLKGEETKEVLSEDLSNFLVRYAALIRIFDYRSKEFEQHNSENTMCKKIK